MVYSPQLYLLPLYITVSRVDHRVQDKYGLGAYILVEASVKYS